MYFKPFTTKEEALAHISEGKPASCQDRLESHLLQGIGEGLDHNQAAERALVLHAHLDHGEGLTYNVDPDFPYTTADEIKNAFAEVLMPLNFDGRAEERIDLVVETLDRYVAWGVTLEYASNLAWIWAREKWTIENVADADLN